MLGTFLRFSIPIFGLVVCSSLRSAEILSDQALYYRCYKQVAQKRAPYNAARTTQVRSGMKDPIDACLEVLDKAKFTSLGNTRIANTGDAEALAVLDTMHNLHASWFKEKQFITFGATGHQNATVGINDNSQPALYYTRALFDATSDINYVIRTSDNLIARRQNLNPGTSANGLGKNTFIFNLGSNPSFRVAPTGQLQGVFELNTPTWNYNYKRVSNNMVSTGAAIIGQNKGAGVMSSPTYLLLNVREIGNFESDGGLKLPRKWGRNVFHDLLCRDLPVIRPGDETSFVVPSSPVPFRQQAACTRCHASMDRLAAVQRNFKYKILAQRISASYLYEHNTSKKIELLLDNFDLGFDKKEMMNYVETFVKIRSRLVHNMKSSHLKNNYFYIFILRKIVSKLILRLLGIDIQLEKQLYLFGIDDKLNSRSHHS